MRVSIAMTTYNGARFVEAQLASLVGQRQRPSQLVIVDDASSDDTPALLDRFAAVAPFEVQVHRNPRNLGWRANFFRALEHCDGDLIGFCDQDDVWHADKIAACAAALDDPRALLVYHGAELVDAEMRRTGDLRAYQSQPVPLAPPQSLGPWKNILGFTMMFRGDLLRFSRYWPMSLDRGALGAPDPHDQWFAFIATTLGHIAYVDRDLALYRQHGLNAVGVMNRGGAAARLRQLVPEPVVRPLTAHRQLVKLADAVQARIAILERIRADEPALAARLDSAIAAYRDLDTQVRLRTAIYAEANPLKRISRARAAARDGAGRHDAWRLPAPPGPWSDMLVRTAGGLVPPIGARLMGARPTLAAAALSQA